MNNDELKTYVKELQEASANVQAMKSRLSTKTKRQVKEKIDTVQNLMDKYL